MLGTNTFIFFISQAIVGNDIDSVKILLGSRNRKTTVLPPLVSLNKKANGSVPPGDSGNRHVPQGWLEYVLQLYDCALTMLNDMGYTYNFDREPIESFSAWSRFSVKCVQ